MRLRSHAIGAFALLLVAFALVPAIAIAEPAITQGVQGVVRDAVTGVPVPFATIGIYGRFGLVCLFDAAYDGTYSFELDAGDDYRVEASSRRHELKPGSGIIRVLDGAVTTQDFSLVQDPDTPEQPVYRFYNMRRGVHFYTASDEEFISVYRSLADFRYEGLVYCIPVGRSDGRGNTNTNEFPLYRFYNRQTGVHFYTMSEAEKNTVQGTLADMYAYEGVAYYVSDDPSGIPVFRFYLPRKNTHFFTADVRELQLNSGLSNYYQYEGIGYYVSSW